MFQCDTEQETVLLEENLITLKMYLNLIHKDNELKVMLKLENMFANSIKIGFKNIEIIIWFGYPSDWFKIFTVTLHYSLLSSSV